MDIENSAEVSLQEMEWTVACPLCGAEAGCRCTNDTGAMVCTHTERIKAYYRLPKATVEPVQSDEDMCDTCPHVKHSGQCGAGGQCLCCLYPELDTVPTSAPAIIAEIETELPWSSTSPGSRTQYAMEQFLHTLDEYDEAMYRRELMKLEKFVSPSASAKSEEQSDVPAQGDGESMVPESWWASKDSELSLTRSSLIERDRELADALRRLAEIEAANQHMIEAINWACGCGQEDFRRIDDSKGGTYWWRSEITKRAGLTYDGERYAAPTEAP